MRRGADPPLSPGPATLLYGSRSREEDGRRGKEEAGEKKGEGGKNEEGEPSIRPPNLFLPCNMQAAERKRKNGEEGKRERGSQKPADCYFLNLV